MKRRLTGPAVACYGAAAAVLVFGYVTGESTCIWRALTGTPCPGCGMGHALIALAQGDVTAAWHFNRGSIAVAPLLAWNGLRQLKELIA